MTKPTCFDRFLFRSVQGAGNPTEGHLGIWCQMVYYIKLSWEWYIEKRFQCLHYRWDAWMNKFQETGIHPWRLIWNIIILNGWFVGSILMFQGGAWIKKITIQDTFDLFFFVWGFGGICESFRDGYSQSHDSSRIFTCNWLSLTKKATYLPLEFSHTLYANWNSFAAGFT